MVLKTVALTGASGMTGSAIGRVFEKNQIQVIRLDRARDPEADLKTWTDTKQLDFLFKKHSLNKPLDAFIHAGAYVPKPNETSKNIPDFLEVLTQCNVNATRVAAEWAFQQKIPFVHISGLITHENPDPITHPYAYSKKAAEEELNRLVLQGLKLILIQAASIYGPGMDFRKMIPKFLIQGLQNKPICISEPQTDRFNLIYSEDVAHAVLLALKKGVRGTFPVGHTHWPTLSEIAQTCAYLTQAPGVTVQSDARAPRLPKITYGLDSELSLKTLGWQAQTSLETGLKSVLNDLKERKLTL